MLEIQLWTWCAVETLKQHSAGEWVDHQWHLTHKTQQALRRGQSIHYLVSDLVQEYSEIYNLYGSMNEERHSGDYPGSFAENTIEANS